MLHQHPEGTPQGGNALRAIDIERWARRIIDRVDGGGPVEDSRVELKRDWLDKNKAARRIAGLCNANAGDDVLWLMGIDEKAGVVGLSDGDVADWWSQVSSEFDGQAPRHQDVALALPSGQIVALAFETDLAPFVVRNAAYGSPGGGAVSLEVPWREATGVRTATRADLLRLLVPSSELPSLELYMASATLGTIPNGYRLSVTVTVYAVTTLGSAVVLPNHQTQGRFGIKDQDISGVLNTELRAWSLPEGAAFRTLGSKRPTTHTIHQGDQQILVEGPGFFRLNGSCYMDSIPEAPSGDFGPLDVSFNARPAGGDLSTTVQAQLLPLVRSDKWDKQIIAQWSLPQYQLAGG